MIPLTALILTISSIADSGGVCASVTRAQAEAALGRSLGPGVEEFTKLDSSCTWSGSGAALTVSVRRLTSALNLPAELANLQAAFPGAKLMELQGFKGRAFALEIPGAGLQLHLLPEGRDYLMVSVMGAGDGQEAFDAAAKVAKALLGKPR
jgi:hypothetical protein